MSSVRQRVVCPRGAPILLTIAFFPITGTILVCIAQRYYCITHCHAIFVHLCVFIISFHLICDSVHQIIASFLSHAPSLKTPSLTFIAMPFSLGKQHFRGPSCTPLHSPSACLPPITAIRALPIKAPLFRPLETNTTFILFIITVACTALSSCCLHQHSSLSSSSSSYPRACRGTPPWVMLPPHNSAIMHTSFITKLRDSQWWQTSIYREESAKAIFLCKMLKLSLGMSPGSKTPSYMLPTIRTNGQSHI
jgi:hypothetical protein